ncbi:MAG: ketoacyl-ACP synthase III [Deferribacteraceae bacterium]|jgi:3-oxoacyl-[acyl-carrier-protein] synthase-3|nr:ketoacyl-ACP synthase III [Deferribacteraceae bacterium]
MIFSRIIGTGSYFPEKVITNSDLEKIVDTTDEWITTRTGMHTRHVSERDEMTSDMALKASLRAIEAAGIKAEEIDGIFVTTVTPDYAFPSTACLLQSKLGIVGAFAMDLEAACTGYIYAQNLANALIKIGQCKTILIASAERLTKMTDYTDRGTCILFGDGAAATIIQATEEPYGILSTNMSADGSFGELLHMKGIGSVMLANRDVMKVEDNLIKMAGNEVFKVAVRMMVDASTKAIADSGLTNADIDFVIPHQANMRIIEAVMKRSGIDPDKALINIRKHGNTSSVTIPSALDEAVREGKVKRGHNVLMTAFGGGFTWGAAVVKM